MASDSKTLARHPSVFWITGLSGSGKSTLALRLTTWLKAIGIHPVVLDGDAIRDILLEPLGHDRNSRLKIARFNARLCRFLAMQGLTVICPTISMFHEVRAWNREHIPGYVEIFLDAPADVVRLRDPKGMYARYDRGEGREVVGLDIPAEYPLTPDLRLIMDEKTDPETSFAQLIDYVKGKHYKN